MPTIPWSTPRPDGGGEPTAGTAGPAEVLVMASRLELRRLRHAPGFLVAALRLRRDALGAPGCLGVSLMAQPAHRTFWTLSSWRDAEAMEAYVRLPRHTAVMARMRGRMRATRFVTWSTTRDALPPDWTDSRERVMSAGVPGPSSR